LATFLVKNGALKGRRVDVKTPVVNIGRADYNDLPLGDPSVSTSHAKLQRREGVWVLVDLDSTNGTFVDGERVQGETAIAPGASLRFGDVELSFEPTDDALGVAKGGGTVVMANFAATPEPPPPPPRKAAAPAPARPAPGKPPAKAGVPAAAKAAGGAKRAPAPAPTEKKGKGCGASVVVLLVGAGGLMAALVHWILA
jgi:predicted component of type VI protein secretion system